MGESAAPPPPALFPLSREKACGDERIDQRGRGDHRRIGATREGVTHTVDRRETADREDRAAPGACLAPSEQLLDLNLAQRVDVSADDEAVRSALTGERRLPILLHHWALEAVDQDEAVETRREAARQLVQCARAPRGAQLGDQWTLANRPAHVVD